MEKNIFCIDCPLRTKGKPDAEEQPAMIIDRPTPVEGMRARHHLGRRAAVEYPLCTADDDELEGPMVLVPAEVPFNRVVGQFESCEGPELNLVTVGSERWHITFRLGQACTALTTLEQTPQPLEQN